MSDPEGEAHSYLFSFFEKTDSSGKALMLVNLDDLDDLPYEQSEAKCAKIKFNGENVKFYRNGELQDVNRDSDGYYLTEMGNGYCWFITFE